MSIDHENVIKMKKLLEVLSSTGQRSSLEVLLRCEAVLEKMDLKGMVIMKILFLTRRNIENRVLLLLILYLL